MKRILIGVMALTTVGGLGVGGAYFARRAMTSEAETQPAELQAVEDPARDLTPTPIPIARHEDQQPRGGNPFASAGRVPEPDSQPSDEGGAAEQTADQARELEIPDAEVAGVDRADAVAPRTRSADLHARYPERQTVAQAAEPTADEAADEPQSSEPRTAATSRTSRGVDRYGRPIENAPTSRAARIEPQATNDPPADEPQATPRRRGPVARRAAPPVAQEQVEAEDTGEPASERPVKDNNPQSQNEEGTGRPGDPRLSGSQAPALTIEKTAPPEIQIGKAAKFQIKVRNAGSVIAHDVEVRDSIPQGTQFIESTPPAERDQQGALAWNLGALKPGEEQKVELQLMPTAEGEIGSVATVHFRAEASVRTLATKPMLNLDVSGPDKVMKGQQVTLKIKVSNPGTGAATGVVLAESVPEGLAHPGGKELELDVGTLKPGESRELELALASTAAGEVTNVVTARGDANLQAEAQTALAIVAPQLQVALAGPKRRYLERTAVHNISVSNPGTAAAKDVELVAVLPKELKFVEANNGGQFDAATRSVYWSLEELPPQETGTVALTTLPLAAGDARLLIKSTAKQNLTDQREEVVAIEGLAAINFQLSDTSDPVEAGGQTSYEIRVTNQGTKAATGVRLVALVPREMKAISAEGPVRYTIEGGRVVFEPLKQLAPKSDTVYSVKVQALEPGDLRLQVQVSTDDIREPITKEESTRVFGDE
jgi:uncharacterized repeat protein (TIGR01451 family)